MSREIRIREQRSEVWSRRSEVRSQKSEVGDRRSEVWEQRSEVRGQRSEVGGWAKDDGWGKRARGQMSEVGSRMTGDRGRKSVGCLRTYLPVYPIFLPALLLIPNIIYPAWHESIWKLILSLDGFIEDSFFNKRIQGCFYGRWRTYTISKLKIPWKRFGIMVGEQFHRI